MHRPALRTATSLAVVVLAFALTAVVLELLVYALLGGTVGRGWHGAVAFCTYDLALAPVLLVLAAHPRPAETTPPLKKHGVSVLVAAFNETPGIAATLRSLLAQHAPGGALDLEVLVGDDGSHDDTAGHVARTFHLVPDGVGNDAWQANVDGTVLRVVRFEHRGKGATLNALASRATHPLLVTLDADTTLAPRALLAIASAFDDGTVTAAAGCVTVRNAARGNLLTRFQFTEYLKNTLVRTGWSRLGGLDQLPGAFTAVRADAFAECGGFPTDSLTEDYELAFRLHAASVRAHRPPPVVVTVPAAQAFTDVPDTLAGLVRQRTRWFAGFLTTMVRFRSLVFRPSAGAFGLVRLPLKLLDAIAPLAALFAVVPFVRASVHPGSVHRAALALALARWTGDACFYAGVLRASRTYGDAGASMRATMPGVAWQWACAMGEAVSYAWLRHLAVLRAYVWAVRRVRTWEPSRETTPRAISP